MKKEEEEEEKEENGKIKKQKQKHHLEDWGSQSLGCPPRSKGHFGGRRRIFSVWLLVGKPQRANKYYLQMGRRSQGGRPMGMWGRRLWGCPTSNKMGQVRLE